MTWRADKWLNSRVLTLAHPERNQVLTSSQEEDITRIYDLSGNLLAEYPGSTFVSDGRFSGLSLGFTEDGKQLLTLSSDRTLRAWPVDGGLDDLVARGCNQLKGYLALYPEELAKLPICRDIVLKSTGRTPTNPQAPASASAPTSRRLP